MKVLLIGGSWDGRRADLAGGGDLHILSGDDGNAETYRRVTLLVDWYGDELDVYAVQELTPDEVLRRLVEGYHGRAG
jgi:hypothetical protein